MYEGVQRAFLDRIRKALLEETIKYQVDQYFKDRKATKALGKSLLRNDGLLALITSLGQSHNMDEIPDPCKVDVFRSVSMPTSARKDGAMAAGPSLVHKASARKSSESSGEERYK